MRTKTPLPKTSPKIKTSSPHGGNRLPTQSPKLNDLFSPLTYNTSPRLTYINLIVQIEIQRADYESITDGRSAAFKYLPRF